MPRNDARRSRFLENCGGSWNNTAPTFGESALSRVSISSIEFAQFSLNRFQWVMNFDAFHANRKSCRGLVAPRLHGLQRRRAIERAIDLGSREVMAVKAKPILFRQIRR